MTEEITIGSVIGGHRVDSLLGQGGMGVVYLAVDLELGRLVALKVVNPELAGDGRFRRRFKQEAQLVARLAHRNIIRIWGYGEDAGVLYVTMEFVNGPDLGGVLRAGALPVRRAIQIVADVAAALDLAHGSGIVHRDVKPQNVLMGMDGEHERAVLSDFGLAKITTADGPTSTARTFVGTLPYAAPEQITGIGVDARTDVYALGCLLFEVMTAEMPFSRDTPMEVAIAHVTEEPPRVSARVPDAPALLDEVVARAMSKDRNERYASAGDLARAATAALDDLSEYRAVGSVGTGQAAADQPSQPEAGAKQACEAGVDHTMPEISEMARARAVARARQRDEHRAADRDRRRAAARLARMTRDGGVSRRRCAALRDRLRPGERPTAAAICAIKGKGIHDVVLMTTNQRVVWVEDTASGASELSVVEAADLAAVECGNAVTLTVRDGKRHSFDSWNRENLKRVGMAAEALAHGH